MIGGGIEKVASKFFGGEGEPIVLLHGATMSWHVWSPLLPALTSHNMVLAPTLLGHIGKPATSRNMTIDDIVSDVEAEMSSKSITTAHIVGNSLGGLVAMELARRGRARSVVAISPAGGWSQEGGAGVASTVAEGQQIVRKFRRIVPVAMMFPAVRKLAFRDIAEFGNRLTPTRAIESLEATADSTLFDHFSEVAIAQPYTGFNSPVLIIWPMKDRIIPLDPHGLAWRTLVPDATWKLLGSVGHVPMIDDPELVAQIILDWTSASVEDPAEAN